MVEHTCFSSVSLDCLDYDIHHHSGCPHHLHCLMYPFEENEVTLVAVGKETSDGCSCQECIKPMQGMKVEQDECLVLLEPCYSVDVMNQTEPQLFPEVSSVKMIIAGYAMLGTLQPTTLLELLLRLPGHS